MPIDETERTRRRALLRAHLDAENAGDGEGVMATFAGDAVMVYNTLPFASPEAILGAHQYIGFAGAAGAFASARNEIDRESFTDTDIVIEGRMCGVHERDFMGFAASGRKVELPFVAFYQFNAAGKLAHERVVMNLGPLRATE
jgi:ketosteroid isomerase-like protein